MHNSQVLGPSKITFDSVFDYCSDSTVKEESNEPIDYDTMHPPSPRKSKGGIVKKSKTGNVMEDMSNTHKVSLLDDDRSASGIHDTDERLSQSEGNPGYDPDVVIHVPNVNITQNVNNKDELSSDVDIAPSGIVAKMNSNSESDEGNIAVGANSHADIGNTGK